MRDLSLAKGPGRPFGFDRQGAYEEGRRDWWQWSTCVEEYRLVKRRVSVEFSKWRFFVGDPIRMATDDELKKALKAFKKRLKLARLDEESSLSRSGGRKSGITGITPPAGHPPGIWEELVARGKLKHDGGGTYSLVPGA